MKFLLFLFSISFALHLEAQKPSIDNETELSWDRLLNYDISNDGRFVWYTYGSPAGIHLTITNLKTGRSHHGNGPMGLVKFLPDNRTAIYQSGDTLILLNLTNWKRKDINNVQSFSLVNDGKSDWISYKSENSIFLMELNTGQSKNFQGTSSVFNEDGTVMLIKSETSLTWIDLPGLSAKKIANVLTNDCVFDPSGKKIVFYASVNGQNKLWFYEQGMEKARDLLTADFLTTSAQSLSFKVPKFSKDGKRIFFNVTKKMPLPIADGDTEKVITSKVNLWHFEDEYPQSVQSKMGTAPTADITAVYNLDDGNVTFLERAGYNRIAGWALEGDDYVITVTTGSEFELNWNDKYLKKYQLVSTKTGESKPIFGDSPIYTMAPRLSPQETFVAWYDYNRQNYFTYEIPTGITRNISKNIPSPLNRQNVDLHVSLQGAGYGYSWFANDKYLLIYDEYDIWQVDPYGKLPPVNITGGVGRKSGKRFRMAADEYGNTPDKLGDMLLVAIFDTHTKRNGLCKIKLGRHNIPDTSSMIDGIYYFPWLFVQKTPKVPIKARDANVYLVQHMSASTSPNVCVTSDFKKYTFVSDIRPEKKYNWMTTKLIKWNKSDGKEAHGVLYMPENFDSSKKYPVIIYYYDGISHELNVFKEPELSIGALSIPWYVSNGYLVFMPDVVVTPGHPGKAVVDAVLSGRKYLSKYPWVDTRKMGLQGHSFGGYETYELVANTNVFAAAQPSAGQGNLISGYSSCGGVIGHIHETGQYSIRSVPWERTDLYIENSPVLKAGNITTPLLIMHNRNDGIVDFAQGVEMFMSLRRQKKPVWLLEYDEEGHILDQRENMLDFTIRQQQFFDHYLRGKPSPAWMREPIPYTQKGIRSGLQIDKH